MSLIIDYLKTFLLSNLGLFLQLAVCAMTAGLTLLLYRPVTRLLFRLLRGLSSRARSSLPQKLCEAFERPAATFLLLLGFYLAAVSIAWGGESAILSYHTFCRTLLRVSIIACVTWGLVRLISPDNLSLSLGGGRTERMSKTFSIFFTRILRIVAAAFGVVIIIGELGYNVGGLITGIGLGGLTIALAAQDWASNLFGGMVILLDKPFEVDDWIQVEGSLEGVVEDITFRSTRVRTFDNSQVVVPNSLLAQKPITNWSRMEKRKISFDLSLAYSSPPEKMKECVAQIRDLLQTTEGVNQDTVSVTFNEFSDSALLLRVYYFTDLTGYADYMRFKEKINFAIIDIVDKLGLQFAFPTRTVYLQSEAPQEKE